MDFMGPSLLTLDDIVTTVNIPGIQSEAIRLENRLAEEISRNPSSTPAQFTAVSDRRSFRIEQQDERDKDPTVPFIAHYELREWTPAADLGIEFKNLTLKDSYTTDVVDEDDKPIEGESAQEGSVSIVHKWVKEWGNRSKGTISQSKQIDIYKPKQSDEGVYKHYTAPVDYSENGQRSWTLRSTHKVLVFTRVFEVYLDAADVLRKKNILRGVQPTDFQKSALSGLVWGSAANPVENKGRWRVYRPITLDMEQERVSTLNHEFDEYIRNIDLIGNTALQTLRARYLTAISQFYNDQAQKPLLGVHSGFVKARSQDQIEASLADSGYLTDTNEGRELRERFYDGKTLSVDDLAFYLPSINAHLAKVYDTEVAPKLADPVLRTTLTDERIREYYKKLAIEPTTKRRNNKLYTPDDISYEGRELRDVVSVGGYFSLFSMDLKTFHGLDMIGRYSYLDGIGDNDGIPPISGNKIASSSFFSLYVSPPDLQMEGSRILPRETGTYIYEIPTLRNGYKTMSVHYVFLPDERGPSVQTRKHDLTFVVGQPVALGVSVSSLLIDSSTLWMHQQGGGDATFDRETLVNRFSDRVHLQGEPLVLGPARAYPVMANSVSVDSAGKKKTVRKFTGELQLSPQGNFLAYNQQYEVGGLPASVFVTSGGYALKRRTLGNWSQVHVSPVIQEHSFAAGASFDLDSSAYQEKMMAEEGLLDLLNVGWYRVREDTGVPEFLDNGTGDLEYPGYDDGEGSGQGRYVAIYVHRTQESERVKVSDLPSAAELDPEDGQRNIAKPLLLSYEDAEREITQQDLGLLRPNYDFDNVKTVIGKQYGGIGFDALEPDDFELAYISPGSRVYSVLKKSDLDKVLLDSPKSDVIRLELVLPEDDISAPFPPALPIGYDLDAPNLQGRVPTGVRLEKEGIQYDAVVFNVVIRTLNLRDNVQFDSEKHIWGESSWRMDDPFMKQDSDSDQRSKELWELEDFRASLLLTQYTKGEQLSQYRTLWQVLEAVADSDEVSITSRQRSYASKVLRDLQELSFLARKSGYRIPASDNGWVQRLYDEIYVTPFLLPVEQREEADRFETSYSGLLSTDEARAIFSYSRKNAKQETDSLNIYDKWVRLFPANATLVKDGMAVWRDSNAVFRGGNGLAGKRLLRETDDRVLLNLGKELPDLRNQTAQFALYNPRPPVSIDDQNRAPSKRFLITLAGTQNAISEPLVPVGGWTGYFSAKSKDPLPYDYAWRFNPIPGDSLQDVRSKWLLSGRRGHARTSPSTSAGIGLSNELHLDIVNLKLDIADKMAVYHHLISSDSVFALSNALLGNPVFTSYVEKMEDVLQDAASILDLYLLAGAFAGNKELMDKYMLLRAEQDRLSVDLQPLAIAQQSYNQYSDPRELGKGMEQLAEYVGEGLQGYTNPTLQYLADSAARSLDFKLLSNAQQNKLALELANENLTADTLADLRTKLFQQKKQGVGFLKPKPFPKLVLPAVSRPSTGQQKPRVIPAKKEPRVPRRQQPPAFPVPTRKPATLPAARKEQVVLTKKQRDQGLRNLNDLLRNLGDLETESTTEKTQINDLTTAQVNKPSTPRTEDASKSIENVTGDVLNDLSSLADLDLSTSSRRVPIPDRRSGASKLGRAEAKTGSPFSSEERRARVEAVKSSARTAARQAAADTVDETLRGILDLPIDAPTSRRTKIDEKQRSSSLAFARTPSTENASDLVEENTTEQKKEIEKQVANLMQNFDLDLGQSRTQSRTPIPTKSVARDIVKVEPRTLNPLDKIAANTTEEVLKGVEELSDLLSGLEIPVQEKESVKEHPRSSISKTSASTTKTVPI